LIDAGTGFQLWSQTYDRDLKDVLSLQTAIATAVSNALKVTLLTDGAHGLELGGTENPKAFDAYLRGESLSQKPFSVANNVQGLAAYDEAIALDQRYVNAYIGRALTLDNLYLQGPNLSQAEAHRTVLAALASARKAVELAPSLGVAHSTVGGMLESMLDYRGALAEYQKGLSLSPGDSRVYRSSARFLAAQGHGDQAIIEARRAVELDPVNPRSHRTLAYVYLMTRHFAESIESYNRAAQIDPTPERQRSDWLGVLYYGLGQYAAARDHCESHAQDWVGYTCLAIVYQKLGRLADAEAQLKKLQDTYGDSASFQQTEIYAQWGDIPRALDALHRAVAMPDPGVGLIKADFLVDPLRNEPRFKAVVAKLGFPD
jgi:tetratricopeptide (TPR) repeat protein